MSFLGIDIGTSTCKVGILHPDGTLRENAASIDGAATALSRGEINPYAWWEALLTALGNVRDELSQVTAVAVIGNTPTLVLTDEAGQPVRPALLWNDVRATAEAVELLIEAPQPEWTATFGCFVPIAAAYPSAKLRWLQRHEPELLKRTHKILQPKDWVNYQLTGVFAGDVWTSKGIVNLAADAEPLERLGIDVRLAPRCVRPVDIIGTLRPAVSRTTGLPSGIPVTAGWSDTLGAVISLGLDSDEAFVVSGTSESIGMLSQAAAVSDAVVTAPVWDTGWTIVHGSTANGTTAVQWAAQLLGIEETEFYRLAQALPSDAGPLFVPYLQGERSPLWEGSLRGAWLGLGLGTTRSELARSVLEGIAMAERDVMLAASKATATVPSRVVLTGGGAHNATWNEVRQAILDRPVVVAESDPVLGAALLAYLGTTGADLEDIPEHFLTKRRGIGGTSGVGFSERGALYERGKMAVFAYAGKDREFSSPT